MTKKKTPSLDVDRTRERLLALGLSFAAAQLDPLLTEAVKETTPSHAFLDRLLHHAHGVTTKGISGIVKQGRRQMSSSSPYPAIPFTGVPSK